MEVAFRACRRLGATASVTTSGCMPGEPELVSVYTTQN